MPATSYLVTAVAAAAVVTWALRALPFTAPARLRASTAVDYLGARIPLGVMVILLAYSLRSLPPADPVRALPDILALAATLGLHLWRQRRAQHPRRPAIHVALATALPAL